MQESSLAERISRLPSVSEAIAESLSEMICNGRLRPGERLIQAKLAAQFGVSRLPVRDALRLLEQRKLVVTRPRRGVVVRPVSSREVREAFVLRRLLEPMAMEEAARRVTSEELAHLEEILDAQLRSVRARDLATAVKLDHDFHERIYSLADNRVLTETIRSIWARTHQARSLVPASERGNSIGEKSVARHRQLLNALRERDPGMAASAILRMISDAEVEILSELQQLGWIEE